LLALLTVKYTYIYIRIHGF